MDRDFSTIFQWHFGCIAVKEYNSLPINVTCCSCMCSFEAVIKSILIVLWDDLYFEHWGMFLLFSYKYIRFKTIAIYTTKTQNGIFKCYIRNFFHCILQLMTVKCIFCWNTNIYIIFYYLYGFSGLD